MNQSEILYKFFVRDIEILYDERQLTYNSHQLLHFALCVRRWGPLHLTSTFLFEGFNGILSKLIHGTNFIGQEIVNNLLIAKGIKILENKIDTARNNENIHKDDTILGKNIIYENISETESNLLSFLEIDVKTQIFSRAFIKNEIYISKAYKEIKTNSFNVEILLKNDVKILGSITFYFQTANNPIDDFRFIIQQFSILHDKIFYQNECMVKVKHILPIEESNNYIVVNVKDIKYIRKLIRVRNYVCKPLSSSIRL